VLWKKIVDGLLFIVFFAFALLQVNDPDSIYWIAIYGVVAIIVLLALIGKQHRIVLNGALIIYILLLLYYSPALYAWLFEHHAANIANSMSTDKMYIEEAREFFGILLCFLTVGFEYYFSRTLSKAG